MASYTDDVGDLIVSRGWTPIQADGLVLSHGWTGMHANGRLGIWARKRSDELRGKAETLVLYFLGVLEEEE